MWVRGHPVGEQTREILSLCRSDGTRYLRVFPGITMSGFHIPGQYEVGQSYSLHHPIRYREF